MAEDAEVGSGMSSTTRLAKNLPSDKAEDAEVGGGVMGVMMKRSKKSPSRKSNGPTGWKTLSERLQNKAFVRPTQVFTTVDASYLQQIWALVRSARSMSSLDTTPHQLSSYDFWAPVLLWVTLPFRAWHLCTKFFSAKRTPSHSYVNIRTHPKRTFSLSGLPLYSPSVFVSSSSRQNASFPTALLVLQYVFKPSQLTKTSTRSENLLVLRYLRCYVVKALYVPEVIGVELNNNKPKKERYGSSLVIVDQLTMIAMALHQWSPTGWFNPAGDPSSGLIL